MTFFIHPIDFSSIEVIYIKNTPTLPNFIMGVNSANHQLTYG